MEKSFGYRTVPPVPVHSPGTGRSRPQPVQVPLAGSSGRKTIRRSQGVSSRGTVRRAKSMRSLGVWKTRTMRIVLSPETIATWVPSELKAARVKPRRTVASSWLPRTAIWRPDCVAHSRTVRSFEDAVTTYKPLGLNWALSTAPLWPLRTALSSPPATLQIRTVPSREPVSSD